MNRPFILGLTGAVVVGTALGLNYLVDSEAGIETAAVLKTPHNITSKAGNPQVQSTIAPQIKDVVPPLKITAVAPSLKLDASVPPKRNDLLNRAAPKQAAKLTLPK